MVRRVFLTGIVLLFIAGSVQGQWFYFGRNKVQYTQFNWHILKTKHFDIYFYPEMEELAQIGATYAEESYRYLENKFNYTINRRIPLIFYSSHLHFQQTNVTPGFIPEGVGGFFEFLKGRVVIPSDGNLNQFKKVIQHELVHVFMHSKVYFANKEHGRYDPTFPPLWFVEGLAEFWSSEWDAQAEMVIRDAVLNNYIIPLSRMYTIAGTYTMYKEGQAVLMYIAQKYGEEKILRLMDDIWRFNNFQQVFKYVLGVNYQEFDREWLYHLKKKYYPLLARKDFTSMTTAAIVKEGFSFKPAVYIREGRKKLVFVGNRTGYSNIYMTDLKPLKFHQKEKVEVLVKGERTPEFEAFHLFSSKIDVSADGRLVFSSKSGETDALYIMDIPSREIINKFQWRDVVNISSPAFSPDGRYVVFAGLHFNGKRDLYLLDLKSETLVQLTNDVYEDRTPSFSPDGTKIVFSSDRTVWGPRWSYNLFVYDLNTHLMYYLTTGEHQDHSPVWSPDGQSIAFVSDRDTTLNIWVADVSRITRWDATSYRQVTLKRVSNFVNAAFDPEWVDNDNLVFAVYENGRFQIRLLQHVQQKLQDKNPPLANVPIPAAYHWKPAGQGAIHNVSQLKYKKKYQLDFAQSQVSTNPFWGTIGGAVFSLTDMLGNDQYLIYIYNNAQRKKDFLRSFNFAVTKISLGKRINYGMGIFRISGRFYNARDGFYFEDRAGGFFTANYPFSQFDRIEFSADFSYSDKNLYYYRRLAYLSTTYLSYIHDNSIWSYTGPIDGSRYNITIGNTYDVRWSRVNYYTLLVDYRRYFRLHPRLTYAVRLLTLWNQGKEARWYYLGGSWDLRGYRLWSLRGEKIVFMSHELRFPFIEYLNIHFPFGNFGLRAIRGAAFVDAGNAWTGKFPGLLGSVGVGIRFNFGGALVLRWDFGRRTDFREFTSGWFTQFFFGWDF